LKYHKSGDTMEVSNVMEIIRSQTPHSRCNVAKASSSEIREENFFGKNIQRVVIYLRSSGCEWALKSGCTMCGHLKEQTQEDISAEQYIEQFITEYSKYDFAQYPILDLYNNGSFFNDKELQPEARREILGIIAEDDDIEMLVLESRPEYIDESKLKETKRILKHKRVEIAIGLETINDEIRELCINKGFTLKEFEVAAGLITSILNLRVYILVKPPFITEAEAIYDAIASIKHCFDIGASVVSLETVTVQDYTLIDLLYHNGLYRTTWLWSLAEIIKATASYGKLVTGLFRFFPMPTFVPHNCERCNDLFFEALKEYNRTLNSSVFNGLTCECRKEWMADLEKVAPPIAQRVAVLDQLVPPSE
jgi:radical SAM enzyme (TIGR01210 family)